MNRLAIRSLVLVLAAAALLAAPAAPLRAQRQPPAIPAGANYTAADVAFMQGMIGHHAQAVTLAGYAEPNGASSEVRVLAGRIAVAQTDEIDFMVNWLQMRKQEVPAADAMAHMHHARMEMGGGGMMPGMLSTAQMDTLAKAKGEAFDWYFLTYMIQHHRGAISMVDDLVAARFAANDDNIFKFVSDVVADQTTEIARMELLLRTRRKP